ncbi:MAG: hypothetical protein L0Z50_13670 [Verrucomicrobiales bacterium]|nr:hypothetical protein [Verrucomicrobiales bacterium]
MSFAEIGAVNAWRTVGTFHIPEPQAANMTFTTLWSAVSATAVARNVSHRKAIEFAFGNPIQHWFALPVSTSDFPYELSAEMLRDALRSAVNLSVTEHSLITGKIRIACL